MNILSCIRRVDGNYVSVTNAHSFFVGQTVKVLRDCDLEFEIGETEVKKVRNGELRLWPKLDFKPGDLLLVTQ